MDYGRLISLEKIEDSAGHEDINEALREDDEELEERLNTLKQESSARFVRRWDEIISKYSHIDDNTQSDEIDLQTGQIVKDNGHLRSLATDGSLHGVQFQPSIWSGDYDFERVIRDEEKEYRNKKRAKAHLRRKLKLQQLFHTSPGDATLDSAASEPLQDNLLILSPSPTKKQRVIASSPIKKQRDTASTTMKNERNTQSTLEDRALWSYSPLPRSKDKSDADYRQDFHSSSPIKHIPSLPHLKYEEEEVYSSEIDSEPDLLFLLMSDLVDTPRMAIFHCALGCSFTAETKSAYKDHLLSNHANLLFRIGYPVKVPKQPQVLRDHITELAILRLTLHFPLQVSIPQKPIECGLNYGIGKCCRVFLDPEAAQKHRSSHPLKCSTRRQVFLCPILGCDYMTDGGYREWREHVLKHKEGQQSYPTNGTQEEVGDVSDIFSDSVSSLSFSEEEDNTLTPHQLTRAATKNEIGASLSLVDRETFPGCRQSRVPLILEDPSPQRQRKTQLEEFEIRSDGSGDEGQLLTAEADYDSLDEFFLRD